MGVRGLKSFIEKNDRLFFNGYHLHDTFVVVDASNLICELYIRSQNHERRDLFGGDMVQYGQFVERFLSILRKCGIEPILVFDGAQAHDETISKTEEKHRRALEKFQAVLSISRCGFGDFILPASATNVFRSIAVDKNLDIVQCMFEADSHIARISNERQCPVISNDSDFFLMDLECGVIPIDSIEFDQKKEAYQGRQAVYSFIECKLFKQENFNKYLPYLDTRNLPLLGILAGNDFVDPTVFHRICGSMSSNCTRTNRQFKKYATKQHDKIEKVLHFLSGKTLNEAINQVCLLASRDKRQWTRHTIRSNLKVYNIPGCDDFTLELYRLYEPGFKHTYGRSIRDEDFLEQKLSSTIQSIKIWLKRAMEHSVLSYRGLELLNKNNIFIISHLDDPQLPSAHQCQFRPMRVMLTLLRSSYNDSSSCFVYDRIGRKYDKQVIKPLTYLKHFGKLNYTIYDMIKMDKENRRAILLATFHCPIDLFDSYTDEYTRWLGHSQNSIVFLLIKFLMDFVDIENQQVRLWKKFRQATLLCMLYLTKNLISNGAMNRPEFWDCQVEEFVNQLGELIKREKYNKMPILGRNRSYNCRVVHQITQMQSAIVSFNWLNALLGDTMPRIRTERWFNSCIIYNLAESFQNHTLKFSWMPEIVYNIPRFDIGRQQPAAYDFENEPIVHTCGVIIAVHD